MSDLISRSALLRYIEAEIDESKEELDDARARGNENDVSYNHGEIAEARRIKRHVNMCAPAVDAVTVVHAMWIREKHGIVRCSCCNKEYKITNGVANALQFFYCPNCGAKMDGGTEC